MIIVADEKGEYVRFRKGTVVLVKREGDQFTTLSKVSLGNLNAILIIGKGKGLSSDVVLECVKNAIPLIFCTFGGKVKGYLVPPGGRNPEVRMKQYQMEEERKVEIGKQILLGKIRGQRYFLYDLLRTHDSEIGREALRELQERISEINQSSELSEILDLEAKSASIYWKAISEFWRNYAFSGRRQRYDSPEDIPNRALNFMYTLLGGICSSCLLSTSLDLYWGILHKYSPRRPALVFDLIEEFRPAVDREVNSLLKEKNPEDIGTWCKHFSMMLRKVYTVRGYRRSLLGHMYEQAKKLERAIIKGERYQAFVVKS